MDCDRVLIHFSCNFLNSFQRLHKVLHKMFCTHHWGCFDYKDPEINDLQFSDDDALAFYHF